MIRARTQAQLQALLDHQEGTRSGEDPEELHQFRVAIRRLRSLLKTAPDADPDGVVRAELKWLAGLTSPVRDLDVLLMRVGAELAEFGPDDQRAGGALVRALRRERTPHQRRLNRAFESNRYADLLAGLSSLAQSGPEVSAEDSPAAVPLSEPYRKLARKVDGLDEDPPDDDLHALRIRGKRLRYAAETAMPTASKPRRSELSALVKACKRLQDQLGEHQDAVVATDRIRAVAAGQDDADVAFVAGRLVEREQARRAAVRATWLESWRRITDAAAPLTS